MKTTAVIAEYNPFHNGHLYQFGQIRKITGSERIIVIMSGDFVQRGGPACADKYARSRMAAECGADMVFELPCAGASSSAEIFASSAVSLADSLGFVDHLCFGCEDTCTDQFDMLADILNDEPDEYRALLRENLQRGMNFPAARDLALGKYTGSSPEEYERMHAALKKPNNILAIEYLRALKRRGSKIQALPVRRVGGGHDCADSSGQYVSARSIRDAIADNDTGIIAGSMPANAAAVMYDYLESGGLLCADDFSEAVSYALLSEKGHLNEYSDVSDDIANRIESTVTGMLSLSEYVDRLQTRNITSARLRRCLFHILLRHKKSFLDAWAADGYSGYASVLAFRRDSQELFSAVPEEFRSRLILRSADREKLSGTDAELSSNDIFASELYRMTLRRKYGCRKKQILSEPVIVVGNDIL